MNEMNFSRFFIWAAQLNDHCGSDLGLKVVVRTQNGRDAMRHLIALGADGIITDRPNVLKDVLREMSLR